MNSEIAIRVSQLSKKYEIGKNKSDSLRHTLSSLVSSKKSQTDEFWALKNVNFEINKGEVVGIIGKNGAGKSTLLKVLSQITKPTSGRVEINGRIASLLEVGTGFHPELTGRENIYLNGTILGMTRKEVAAKFDEIVEFSGVEKFIDTPVKRYSSGMYVRLAFAVAAHLEPEILVIDEVLAVGDAEFQNKCLGKMQDVAGQGRTVLFVSHNMAAVKSLCTTGIFMKDGTSMFKGSVEEVFRAYNSIDSSNEVYFDFTDNQSTRGVKHIIIKSIELSKAILNPESDLKLNISLEDRIGFKGTVEISLFVLNEYNDVVYQFNSRAYNGKMHFENNMVIRCLIEEIALKPGIYTLGVWLGGNGFEQDYIDTIQITIEDGSIHEIKTAQDIGLVQKKFHFEIKQG